MTSPGSSASDPGGQKLRTTARRSLPRLRGPTSKTQSVDLKVPGIVLTVTGVVALIVSITRGPNLDISRRTGVTTGAVLLVLGIVLLVSTVVTR
jgi:hypothetical protein